MVMLFGDAFCAAAGRAWNGTANACFTTGGWTSPETLGMILSVVLIITVIALFAYKIPTLGSMNFVIAMVLMALFTYFEWFPLWIFVGLVVMALVYGVLIGAGIGLPGTGGGGESRPGRRAKVQRERRGAGITYATQTRVASAYAYGKQYRANRASAAAEKRHQASARASEEMHRRYG